MVIAHTEKGKTMTDYIKREEVYDQLDRWARDLNNPNVYPRDDARCVIDGIIAEDVAPVRHGRWESYKTEVAGRGFFYCTKCHNDTYSVSNYCPCCGAKMDGDEE